MTAFHPSPDKFAGFRIPAEILDRVDVVCERALFVINRNGVIFWSYRSPIAVNPGADGILDALERMQPHGASHERPSTTNSAA